MSFGTEFAWLKGYAKGSKLENLLSCLYLAEKLHDGQKRKNGEPYLIHPVRVTCALASLGITDDSILATAMLHDVIEDCNIVASQLRLVYRISEQIVNNVQILSKNEYTVDEQYFKTMEDSPQCTLVKLADRCNNVSTMVGAFTNEKMISYIEETRRFIIPLAKIGRKKFPQYTDQIYYMKYHLESICDTIEGLIGDKNNESN